MIITTSSQIINIKLKINRKPLPIITGLRQHAGRGVRRAYPMAFKTSLILRDHNCASCVQQVPSRNITQRNPCTLHTWRPAKEFTAALLV